MTTDQDRLALADEAERYAREGAYVSHRDWYMRVAKALRALAQSGGEPVAYPSVAAMKSAVELEIEKCLGIVTTQSIGALIQKAIDASYAAPIAGEPGAWWELVRRLVKEFDDHHYPGCPKESSDDAKCECFAGALIDEAKAALASAPQPAPAPQEPDDPRRDCPWKCRPDDLKCLCANQQFGKDS